MNQALELKLVAPQQYGSCGKSIEQVLNKRLTYDITRLKRPPVILLSNDAKACYDRIAHSALSLAL